MSCREAIVGALGIGARLSPKQAGEISNVTRQAATEMLDKLCGEGAAHIAGFRGKTPIYCGGKAPSHHGTAGERRRERDIEAYLVKRVKKLGGECRKVKWLDRRGAPDRVLFLPSVMVLRDGLDKCVWVELKAPGKKPEPHQLREHERMRKMGQRVEVIDSFEGVDQLLGAAP